MNVAFQILRQTVTRWNDHDAPRLAAAIAFYTLLSLAPFLIFMVAILSFIFGRQAVEDRIAYDASLLIGRSGADTIQVLMASGRKPVQGTIANLIAGLTLLFGASSVFGELRDALNTIWDANPTRCGIGGMIEQKAFAVGLVMAGGVLLVISMLATTAVSLLGHLFADRVPFPLGALELGNFLVSLGSFTVLLALIFGFMPAKMLRWKIAWTGAAVTALLLVSGKTVLGLYFGWASVGSAYGAAGSLGRW
jgi:membrane protein